MPELPEVETVRRGLQPAMEGASFSRVEQRRADLRFPFPERFVERLTGRTVVALTRRAKYLVAELDDGAALIMHLGMSGRFIVLDGKGGSSEPGGFYYEDGRDTTHDHVVFHLSNGATVIYNDTRRFGLMDLASRDSLAVSKHFKGMGIEPLGNEFDGEAVARLFAGKKAPLKAALLDQRLIAGLGNIYVCEALFRAGLSPKKRAGIVADAKGKAKPIAHELAAIIRDVLGEAIEAGGSTLRDYAQTDGSLGYFQHRFRVYDREGEACLKPGCKGAVKRLVQSGRSTFYCGVCQK
ncbi:bifunctional DNA-formamidopyrimidine glycosylase/DNA-(apurinic or apyrimidinic site) lyase [Terrarubrum flagellatum]|uniref:bifunctional DNA-formamidopyrimidine glycosylase/DNA-(apurinic or apyrimidinic site) lyase n=1 Tax=Terrirubrum flagellatum TaxID=2895980 RepID=UPI003144E63E